MEPILLVLLFSILGYIIYNLLAIQIDPREPPFVAAKIPYIGHAIGILRYGANYWVQVNYKHKLPIFTAGLLNKKFYVVTSLDLVSSIQKKSKAFSFLPFLTMTAEKVSGLPPEQVKLFTKHQGRTGLAEDTITGVEATLRQADVDALNVPMLECLKSMTDEVMLSGSGHCKLHAWLRHLITQSTTKAIYGADNPFDDLAVESAFWTFEENVSVLLNDFLPKIAVKKGLAARDVVAKAFTQYYRNGSQKRASALAYFKWQSAASYGLGEEEIALIEVPFIIGVLNNTIPTTFWTLSRILSDPTLLFSIRSELAHTTESFPSPNASSPMHNIDMGLLKRKCPLLLSVYHEILRTRTSFSVSRFVESDTSITDGTKTYLLKAGSLLQIPGDIIHAHTDYWGHDSARMDPYRFVDSSKDRKKKKHPLAFRSFGGAPFICPGRQFATTEVLATVAMLIMRFEILPMGGTWAIPNPKLSLFGSIPPPAADVEVVFRQREGWDGKWDFRNGEAGVSWVLESG
ncbi:MAG: hypothetical protein Q9187_001932 [Circinaria calcarea]